MLSKTLIFLTSVHLYSKLFFNLQLAKARPPLPSRKAQINRDIQEAGTRSSSHNTGSKYSARSQTSRFNQEQGKPTSDYYRQHQKRNQYSRTPPYTTPRSIHSPQRKEIYIYNTETTSKFKCAVFQYCSWK